MTQPAAPVRGWRRWAARIALALTVFAALQPALVAPAAAGPLRYLDVSAKTGNGARHDHDRTLCHTCAGHICLEQHSALDQPPIVLLALPPDFPQLAAPMREVLWPHPATAPPLWRIAEACRPRAPPLFA